MSTQNDVPYIITTERVELHNELDRRFPVFADFRDAVRRAERVAMPDENEAPDPATAPRALWVVCSIPDEGAQPWSIGIEGKGVREWFDTRADAERAVALLNKATMP